VKIVIHGAGSVGCYVGGAWLAAGLDTTFLGRARIGEELAAHGLTLSDTDGWHVQLAPDRIRFETDPKALKQADIVILTVKSIGTEAAAAEIARFARKGAAVISIQNGISNAETLTRLLPKQRVLQGMVPYNVVHLGPGRWHRTTWGDLTVEDDEVTRALAAAIGDRPGRLRLSPRMEAVMWGKLVFNLNNAINALSGETILAELKQRDYRRVFAAAIMEMLELLDLAGIEPARIGKIGPRQIAHVIGAPDFVFNNMFLKIQKIDPKGRGSMADDFAAGRQTEVDYLNGEVVRLAGRLGRTAPVNAAIVDLVKQHELGVHKTWTAKALREHVLGKRRAAPGFGY
jgi:2-dehydropantoate 2-reductase